MKGVLTTIENHIVWDNNVMALFIVAWYCTFGGLEQRERWSQRDDRKQNKQIERTSSAAALLLPV